MRSIYIAACLLLAAPVQAQWEYESALDPFDDTDRSFILPSLSGDADDAVLGLKCLSDGINLVFFHGYMIGDDDDEVRYLLRVDKNDTFEGYAGLFSSQKSSWELDNIDKIIAELRTGNEVVIRVIDPYDGEVKDGRFNLRGFSAAFSKLSDSCSP